MRAEAKRKFNKSFGRVIAGMRKAAGISQESIAKRLGVTRSAVANMEAGRQSVFVSQLFVIAHLCGRKHHTIYTRDWARALACRA